RGPGPRSVTCRRAPSVALSNSTEPLASAVAALVQSQGPDALGAASGFIVQFFDLERLRAEHRHGAKLAPPPSVSATYTVRTGCGDDVSRKQESHAGSARVKVPGDRGCRFHRFAPRPAARRSRACGPPGRQPQHE